MYNKEFFNKVFSDKRMERYFNAHPLDEYKAILHYQCNLELAESFYVCLSVFEVALKNSLSRELEIMTGKKDWYSIFLTTPELMGLNDYITRADQQIAKRKKISSPDTIIAELSLGFWVALFNKKYERLLWKSLRKAFPYMPKKDKQRKNISNPLNIIKSFRNRIFHNESICWNLSEVEKIHDIIVTAIMWIDKDIPEWVKSFDRFEEIKNKIKKTIE
jgi:hypothetical protein